MPCRFLRPVLAVLGLASLSVLLVAQPQDVHPVRSGEWAQSLNGTWKFRYEAGAIAAGAEQFAAPDFADTGWAELPVPSHWELHGFAEPKYATTDAGAGYYRRHFTVPAAWAGQRIFLHFDGALYGVEAWVNGRHVGDWAGSYNPVAFDATDAIRLGGDNVVAVRVGTRVKGWEFDTNDCWGLSGIFRDVTLFAVPPAHLCDYTARTTVNTDGSAAVTITAITSVPAVVHGRLLGPGGEPTAELSFASDQPTVAEARFTLTHPELWTAETPALYKLELTVAAPGQRPQVVTERIGLREVTIGDGVLRLNGRPIKLRGTDHHDLWPIEGRVATETLMRRDLALMRAANINFIRTSHYPPHPRFLELCDELGFYVMDEVPFGFGDDHLTDPSYQDILLTRANATVRRDHNRPSVIIWSVGNENPNTPLTFATGRRVKDLDPSRPLCFPQMGSYFAQSYRELPDWVDVYAPHYPSTETVRAYAEKLTRPVIFTEYAHALGLAADQVQAQWALMQANPRLAGGAVWMFQDQGILRPAKAAQSPDSTPDLGLAVWPDAKHYYDTAGNLGMDGIVYSDRTPQPDYWQVRKVYSPVQITAPRTVVAPGLNHLSLVVENRFDFRTLRGVTLDWSLRRNGTAIEHGSLPLHAGARAREEVPLAFTLPAAPDSAVYALELRCSENGGESFYERNFRLDLPLVVGQLRTDAISAGWPVATPVLEERPDQTVVRHERFILTVGRTTGEIVLRDRAGRILASGISPHTGRRFTEGERMRSQKELTWTGTALRATGAPELRATRMAQGIALRLRGRYERTDAPGQALEGTLDLLVRPNGTIEIGYDYAVLNGRGLILEAGVALTVPAAATELRWIGAGPFAGYPGKDALNEFGLYHLHRADLRFQGNRRATELALLTDPTGRGVALAGQDMDFAAERVGDDTVLSHLAAVSGRGTKFAYPDTAIDAEKVGNIAGHFTLLPLSLPWPAPLTAWFGPPDQAAKYVQQPFYHSYDQ